MIARTTRTVFEIAAASFLGVALLASVAAWRLAQGPVPLDFLTEHFERALNGKDMPFRITMAGTNLAWAGWQRTLDIRVVDVRATGENGNVIARVPEMSVSMSLGALLRGVVAPRSLDLIGASLRVVRQETGQFALAFGAGADHAGSPTNAQMFERLLGILGETPDPDRPITYLRRVSVLDAKLTIDDRLTGAVWGAPRADIVVLREQGEVRGTFFTELDVGGTPMKVNGAASWRPGSDLVTVETELSGARIDRIAAKLPSLGKAEAVSLDVNGRITLTMSLDGAVQTAAFDLAAGEGRIALVKMWPDGLHVKSVRLRGSMNKPLGRLEIDEFLADLGASKLTGQLSAVGLDEGGTVDGRVTVDRMSLKDLGRFWPQNVAPLARSWVIGNMPGGIVEDARATMSLAVADGAGEDVRVRALSGTLRLRDTEIRYLKGLPPVREVAADAVFSLDRFIAHVQSGRAENLRVTSGNVRLTALDTDNERASVKVSIDGPLANALSVVDRPPLKFVSRFGLDPSAVEGSAKTQLTVSLPLRRDLQLGDIDIAAASTLHNPRMPDLAFGQIVSAKELSLKVDKQKLELSGDASIGGVPATLKWVERFAGTDEFTRTYDIRAKLTEDQRRAMGLVDMAPYLTGPVAADLAIQQSKAGLKHVALKLALNDAALWMPGFNWQKPRGRNGVAWLTLIIAADGRLTVKNFNVRTASLTMSGSARFDRNHRISGLEITNFDLDRNKFVGTVTVLPEGGYDVKVNGPMLDAAPFLDDQIGEKPPDDWPPLVFHLNFDRVWLNEKMAVDSVTADLIHDSSGWRDANVTGLVGENQKVTFSYSGGGGGEKIFVRSSDAGKTLRGLGIVETMQGGNLKLSVVKQKNPADQPWKGNMQITDFVLVKAPLLARVLTGASLTGIVDTLSGKGIRFAKLDIPIEFKDGVANVRNARTVGSELGFTAEGRIDTRAERIALTGTIVPAYTLNSLLGNIPILGKLFTGRKGSGVFAATYRVDGPLKDPNITVNPLAALAPGFLRNLLGIFDSTASPTAPAPSAADRDER